MARTLWILAGIALSLTSCTRTSKPEAQGQTHWWQSCDTNADCGAETDLACICSVCMVQCARSGDSCEVEGRQAECFGANASAVQAFCGGGRLAPAAVCLESCESECGDGFRCAGGACIAIEPQPQPMAGRDGTSGAAGGGTAGVGGRLLPMGGRDGTGGAAGGGAAGTGDQDGGQPQPMPTPTTIELVNATSAPVYAQTSDCNGMPRWFRIGADGKDVNPLIHCTLDCATNPSGPIGCPAVCRVSEFQMLEPQGGMIRFEWDGMQWTYGDPRGCADHVSLASGTEIELTFCWLTEKPVEDVPGFPREPSAEDLTCEVLKAKVGSAPVLRFTIDRQ